MLSNLKTRPHDCVMDDQTRIIKLEVEMESLRESNARLQRSVDSLHGELVDLREYLDRRLAAQQASNDENFREVRASMERGFAECRAESRAAAAQSRKEAKEAKRWLIGILVSIALGLTGIAAKFLLGA